MPGRNPAAAIRYASHHQNLRKREMARFVPGTPCPQVFYDGTICGQPMFPGQRLHLGHAPGGGYLGLVHAFCNERDGSQRKALAEGKQLRSRDCPVCKRPFKASRKNQRTCGMAACIMAAKRQQPAVVNGRPW
jgi:hypothetical protein